MNNPGANQIARKIHDGIAQDLVALGYRVDQALGEPELPKTTRLELRNLRFGITDLIEKVRREILNLRSSTSNLEEVAQAICGTRLTKIDLQVELDEQLQSIAVELLRNAVSHSGASVITLRTHRSNALTIIEVCDNGTGSFQMKSDRFGLIGVSETVAIYAGKIEFIETSPGLLVRVSIPT